MASLFSEYIPITKENEFIKISISFNKDTVQWATSQPKQIGYQLTATPVTRELRDGRYWVETSGAFTGFFKIILPIERQSSKRLQTAIEQYKIEKESFIKWFEERGYSFPKNDEAIAI